MNSVRDYGAEIDAITMQLNELKQLVLESANSHTNTLHRATSVIAETQNINREQTYDPKGAIFYSGHYEGQQQYRWEPQQREVNRLLDIDEDKMAKILAAISHKQRLDILKAVLRQPLTGAELVEHLNMGTTGQLYHHTKALIGANLLVQEDRGGKYSIPSHRSLPLLLLMAAASDLLDASDYLALAETRDHAGDYLGGNSIDYDPHHLLLAVIENCILEHQAGHCSEVHLILHQDNSITVADNGRGIPVQAMKESNKSPVQAVLTELSQYGTSASFIVPGSAKGINMAVVNALSEKLTVDVRRDGRIYRQVYKHGIPQDDLSVVGVTKETGTSITWTPDRHIFRSRVESKVLERQIAAIAPLYPGLTISIL